MNGERRKRCSVREMCWRGREADTEYIYARDGRRDNLVRLDIKREVVKGDVVGSVHLRGGRGECGCESTSPAKAQVQEERIAVEVYSRVDEAVESVQEQSEV